MAAPRKQTDAKGEVYYLLQVSRGHDKAPYRKRWYPPKGVAQSTVSRELKKATAEFERACAAGEIVTRAEKKEKAVAEAAEAAKVKTLRDYCETVFMPQKAVTCSENTRSSFNGNLTNHIYPVLGSAKMTDITSAQITALLISFQKNHAHASCIKLYTLLNLIFKEAFLTDVITVNPMLKVTRPKPRKDEIIETEPEAYTADELRTILQALKDEPLKWQAYMSLLADTGMRRGEAGGLMWKHINYQDSTIRICQTVNYTPAKGIYIDTPKSGKSREVPVSALVVSLLKQLQKEQAASCMSKWVFSQEGTTEPMHPQSPDRWMKKFSARNGIEHLHPHRLRHTFASLALTNGADVESVAEILGHADSSVTLKVYAHASEESKLRAAQKFREAVYDDVAK